MLLRGKSRGNLGKGEFVAISGPKKANRRPSVDEDNEIAAVENGRFVEKRGVDNDRTIRVFFDEVFKQFVDSGVDERFMPGEKVGIAEDEGAERSPVKRTVRGDKRYALRVGETAKFLDNFGLHVDEGRVRDLVRVDDGETACFQ